MKNEVIENKIKDLDYRVKLDELAIRKAEYNLKYAKRLRYTDAEVDSLKERLNFYNSKIINDRCTLDVFRNCYLESKSHSDVNSDYLFKCTFPYVKVDNSSFYQTSITVPEEVAKYFANGVTYQDVINCLEEEDIKDIQSSFTSKTPKFLNSHNVGVEVIEKSEIDGIVCDAPVIARQNGKSDCNLIASKKITTCYPYGFATYNNLGGSTFIPTTPSLNDICKTQSYTLAKEAKLNRMATIEATVKNKMQESIDKMNLALDEAEAHNLI